MNFLNSKYLIIFSVMLICNATGSTQVSMQECSKKCEKVRTAELRNGEFQCAIHPQDKVLYEESPCVLKCLGMEPEKDQGKCWCDYCKQYEHALIMFCTEPGKTDVLTPEDCDKLVCTGKAKFRESQCWM